MVQVSVREAKTGLSKLIRLVESEKEDEVQITRNGKPVVKIVPLRTTPASNGGAAPASNGGAAPASNGGAAPASKRIGVAEGKFIVPEDLDAGSAEINESLMGGDLF